MWMVQVSCIRLRNMQLLHDQVYREHLKVAKFQLTNKRPIAVTSLTSFFIMIILVFNGLGKSANPTIIVDDAHQTDN